MNLQQKFRKDPCSHMRTQGINVLTHISSQECVLALSDTCIITSRDLHFRFRDMHYCFRTCIFTSGPALFWHERAAFQLSAVGWSTAGNDVVATIIISLFFFSPPVFPPVSSVATFSHRRSARIKKLI